MSRASKILESLNKRKTFSEAWTKKSVENLKDRIYSDLKLVVEDEYKKQKDSDKLHPEYVLRAAQNRVTLALAVFDNLRYLVFKAEYLTKNGRDELPDFEIDNYTSKLEELEKAKDKIYTVKLFPTVDQVLK